MRGYPGIDSPNEHPLFADPPAPLPATVEKDQGKESRNETYQQIVDRLSDDCKLWLLRIIAAGDRGITLYELSEKYRIPQNAFSGRITKLKEYGLVRHTKERRPTKTSMAAVIVATARAIETKPKQREFDEMTTRTTSPVDIPDAVFNPRWPKDTHGDPITNGKYRYVDGKQSMVVMVEESAEGDLAFFWPVSAPSDRRNHEEHAMPDAKWERVKS